MTAVIGSITPIPTTLRRHSLSAITLADSQGYNIGEISNDRSFFFAFKGPSLYTTVDGSAYTLVHTFPYNIQGVIPLPNGEILVGAVSGSLNPAFIFKSSGFVFSNPTAATFTLKLTTIGGRFSQEYSLTRRSVHADGRVIVSEAGPQTDSSGVEANNIGAARRLWLSKDFGETWAIIFDIWDNALVTGPIGCHLHACCIEPQTNGAIWLTFGDDGRALDATSGSGSIKEFIQLGKTTDDGVTWEFLTSSSVPDYGFIQWVAIRATTERLIVLPDYAPYAPMTIERNIDGSIGGTGHAGPNWFPDGFQAIVGGKINQAPGTDGSQPWPIFMGAYNPGAFHREKLFASSNDGLSIYEIYSGPVTVNAQVNVWGPSTAGIVLGNSAQNNSGAWTNGALFKATLVEPS